MASQVPRGKIAPAGRHRPAREFCAARSASTTRRHWGGTSMLTTWSRRLIPAFVAIALLGAAPSARADIITFDGTLNPQVPPSVSTLTIEYRTQTVPPGPAVAFTTQGFVFGGATSGVTTSNNTTPDFDLVLNAALCPQQIGIACVSNGTKYIVTGEPWSLQKLGGGFLRGLSFDAAQLFGGSGCPIHVCDDTFVVPDAATVSVFAFRSGVQVAFQQFALKPSFQTFTLTAPGFVNAGRIVFAFTGTDGGPFGLAAIDNIQAQYTDSSVARDFDKD